MSFSFFGSSFTSLFSFRSSLFSIISFFSSSFGTSFLISFILFSLFLFISSFLSSTFSVSILFSIFICLFALLLFSFFSKSILNSSNKYLFSSTKYFLSSILSSNLEVFIILAPSNILLMILFSFKLEQNLCISSSLYKISFSLVIIFFYTFAKAIFTSIILSFKTIILIKFLISFK